MKPTEHFLNALWPDGLLDQWLLVYTLPDRASHWCDSIAQAVTTVEGLKGVDIYLQMGLADKNYGPFARATRNNVTAIPGLWCDLDLKAEGRKKTALPQSLGELLKIIPEDARPTMLVQSGSGLHAYWLFNEPMTLETERDRARAEALLKDWQILLRRRAQVHGWTLDFTHDLPRILRVPGTLNLKNPENPRIVALQHDDGPRYWPEELREMLDESSYAAQSLGVVEEREDMGDGWKSLGLQITPHLTVDEDMIEQLCQISPKFRLTWNHDRSDIDGPDGAFSEYDLALANFGVAFEMTPQQIAAMMVAFRRRHGGKPKWRPDYYRRTIWRAMHDRREPAGTQLPAITQGATQPSTAEQENPGTPELTARALGDEQRVELLDQLGLWLGIRILRITKVSGKDPSYLIETETAKVDIDNVHKLLDQKYMRGKLSASCNVLITRYQQDQWDAICAIFVGVAVVRDGGEELEVEGEARLMLENYLRSRPFASPDSREPGKEKFPMAVEGEITVSLVDIRNWMGREYGPGEKPSLKHLAFQLTSIEARKIRWRRGNSDGHRWALPAQQWPTEQWVAQEKENIA